MARLRQYQMAVGGNGCHHTNNSGLYLCRRKPSPTHVTEFDFYSKASSLLSVTL